MTKRLIEQIVEMPEGVTATVDEGICIVKGKQGECKKNMKNPKVEIKVEGNKIIFTAKKGCKTEKARIGSFAAHLRNMIKGVEEKHIYKLKICSGHFPMNVAIKGKEFIVKNFLGEKVPRIIKLKEGVNVKIDDTLISIESVDKELAGQTAGDIEQLTRITNRDLRIFQDGIYITDKSGKKMI